MFYTILLIIHHSLIYLFSLALNYQSSLFIHLFTLHSLCFLYFQFDNKLHGRVEKITADYQQIAIIVRDFKNR